MQTVVGQPFKPARNGSTAGGDKNEGAMTSCHWDAASEAIRAPDVTLMVWTWPAGTKGAQNYIHSFSDAHKQDASIPEPETVSLGDEAIWDGMGVDVRKGDVNFSLAIVGPDKPIGEEGDHGTRQGRSSTSFDGSARSVLGQRPRRSSQAILRSRWEIGPSSPISSLCTGRRLLPPPPGRT